MLELAGRRIFFLCSIALGMAFGVVPSVSAQSLRDNAAKSNQNSEFYVTESNGPWMVKVASFSGESASEYANSLAKELRDKHRLEAYVYHYKVEFGRKAVDQKRAEDFEKKYFMKPKSLQLANPPASNWVVLAGNFSSVEDRASQTMINKIKKIEPKSVPASIFSDRQFLNADGKANKPLATAMLIRNPLAPAEKHAVIDPATAKMLRELNDHEQYSAYNIPADFTIMVKEFQGVALYEKKDPTTGKIVADAPGVTGKNFLQKAAQDAVILTDHLRKLGVEAYVFHGKFASIVTVGGYQSGYDPRLQSDIPKLRALPLGQLHLDPTVIPTPRRPEIAQVESQGGKVR